MKNSLFQTMHGIQIKIAKISSKFVRSVCFILAQESMSFDSFIGTDGFVRVKKCGSDKVVAFTR